DATLVGGLPQITVNTGGPGNNNHTFDFGFITTPLTPTPTPSTTPPPPPPPQGTPLVGTADPVVVKLADPVLALPGEEVRFNITVTTLGTPPALNVIVSDLPGPAPLFVTGVIVSKGPSTTNGNNVTVPVGTINPGQTMTIPIVARVRSDIIPPLDLTNTVSLD